MSPILVGRRRPCRIFWTIRNTLSSIIGSCVFSKITQSAAGIALYNGGAALFRTMGHSDVSLKVSLLMNSINVIGNAVLIFGFGMDVAGVAIPTLVSRTVAAVVILSLLFNRDLMLHLSDIRGFHLNMRLMKNIFYIGVPSGVENGMFQLGRLVLFSLISTFGTASMVANAIGNTISNFNCFAAGKQAMRRACQGEKKTAQRRKGLPARVLRIERRSNQPQIRKGRYFAYGRRNFYESK